MFHHLFCSFSVFRGVTTRSAPPLSLALLSALGTCVCVTHPLFLILLCLFPSCFACTTVSLFSAPSRSHLCPFSPLPPFRSLPLQPPRALFYWFCFCFDAVLPTPLFLFSVTILFALPSPRALAVERVRDTMAGNAAGNAVERARHTHAVCGASPTAAGVCEGRRSAWQWGGGRG